MTALFTPHNIAVIGASGAIGKAFTTQLSLKYPNAHIYAFSQKGPYEIDYRSEQSIAKAASLASKNLPLDMVIVTNGMLHTDTIMPEKSLKELSSHKFQKLFQVNTITPALIAKYFLPTLHKDRPVIFVALSARVGSISDNQLGGWYAYRASKAALNMIIKTAAIEFQRRNKEAMIIGLHPGTVDSNLSKPFQGNLTEGTLFTADDAVQKMLSVLEGISPTQTGKCFAWDGEEIPP